MTRPAPLRDLEPSQFLLVDDQVQGDDPSVDDCAAGYGDRCVHGTDKHPDRAVDERESSLGREPPAARTSSYTHGFGGSGPARRRPGLRTSYGRSDSTS
jgi:hypothetical protein